MTFIFSLYQKYMIYLSLKYDTQQITHIFLRVLDLIWFFSNVWLYMGNPFKCRLWYFGKAQPDVVEITSESLEETHVRLLGSFAQEKHLRIRSLFAPHLFSLLSWRNNRYMEQDCCGWLWSPVYYSNCVLTWWEIQSSVWNTVCVCVLTGGWRGPPCSSSLCLESTTLCLPSPRRISASGSDWCLSWAWAPSRYWASDFIVATLVLYFKKHLIGDYFSVPIPSELAS